MSGAGWGGGLIMANDHFVARTYLKHFGDASNGDRLYGYRKSNGDEFPCRPRNICREWDGDINESWLARCPDLLGQFRKMFEPLWNGAVESLISGACPPPHRFAVAGYVANLMTSVPAWRRVGVQLYNDHATAYLLFAKRMKEKHGDPLLPVDAITMLERGTIKLDHEPDYIKAVVTRQLLEAAWAIYHQDWTLLSNPTPHPFLTSDNPVAIEEAKDFREPSNHFVAITPKLGLQLRNRRSELPPITPKLREPLGITSRRTIQATEAKQLNRLVARCAEDLVLSSTRCLSLAKLVRNASKFRVETEFVEFPGHRTRRHVPCISHSCTRGEVGAVTLSSAPA
jgi:hypothetical protein